MDTRDLDFLFEVGTLGLMKRGWHQHVGSECASVAAHSFRVMWLALIIARGEGNVDENKVLKMALAHDVAESRVSDLSYVQKVYVKADEERALGDMLKDSSISDFNEVVAEFEKRESLESKIVKDADNLDIDLELKELESRGSQMNEKWHSNRVLVHERKLYTETAKKIWEQIQAADPDNWHMTCNKWIKVPEAGK